MASTSLNTARVGPPKRHLEASTLEARSSIATPERRKRDAMATSRVSGLTRTRQPVAFTQEDRIGLAGGMNLYGFASGDPVNYSDPFGLWPNLLAGGLGGLQCAIEDVIGAGSTCVPRVR